MKKATKQELRILQQIEDRINTAIRPLQDEMRIMNWNPEYQAIVWEALAYRCLTLESDARRAVLVRVDEP